MWGEWVKVRLGDPRPSEVPLRGCLSLLGAPPEGGVEGGGAGGRCK